MYAKGKLIKVIAEIGGINNPQISILVLVSLAKETYQVFFFRDGVWAGGWTNFNFSLCSSAIMFMFCR